MYELPDVSSAHTQSRQLKDHEEIFAEFDKKCIGLELQTTPLSKTKYQHQNELKIQKVKLLIR